ncbi:hypothetical protein FA15DRAFT_752516 [Coprinopsis marcescibilis]|uniref:SUZ domain-containing protein n=1 Tax=Coprinopsis marcescibilis TaxID=230819 RepID=A0A5C3LM04_COPMA|nr:hypothetical protein FA15DRAFT_752516 [Coprinopsis marcescibilis]
MSTTTEGNVPLAGSNGLVGRSGADEQQQQQQQQQVTQYSSASPSTTSGETRRTSPDPRVIQHFVANLQTSSSPMTILNSANGSGNASHSTSAASAGLANSNTNVTVNATGSSSNASPSSSSDSLVDPQILEALKSKDRIYVLKLGELMEGMIKEKRQRVDLTPATSYQRLLVHRCSAYYKLAPENDPVTKGISVHPTTESRIPERRICELVPPESSSQPTFKIMLRSAQDRRNKSHSQAGSVTGEDGDLSDGDPSEAGSLGGRSYTTGSKKHMTIQQREAAYNEARSRIFMDFEEKEKAKEKDMSASSSSLSLTSASASSTNGDTSSLGDVDESVGSPTTESEWSGPSGQFSRERKDGRRGGSGNASASSSTRSLRDRNYHGNSSNPSSRNSRASSPSFTYASLYEPAPSQQLYDPNQPQQPPAPYGTQYYHPFAPPSQAPTQGFASPYPYYPQYSTYQQPMVHDPHHHNPSDQPLPRNIEPYPPQHMGYPYLWNQPNQSSSMQTPPVMQSMTGPPHQQQGHQQQGHQTQGHAVNSPPAPPPHSPPQYPYMPPPGYGYPIPGMTGYFPLPPPPGGPPMAARPPPPMQGYGPVNTTVGSGENTGPPPPNGGVFGPNGRAPMNGPGVPQQQGIQQQGINGRNPPSRSNSGHGSLVNGNGGSKRSTPATVRSGGWGYGPIGGSTAYIAQSSSVKEAVGPRLTPPRRQSNVSGSSSNNDDGLSTASSSTTSSSSRRTYTSTTSSQHPLPPRPDWAVGMKAQPTLAASRHHDPRQGPIGRNGSNANQAPPVSLQSNDFPPLTTSASVSEKKNPIPTGAWGNSASRAILTGNGASNGPHGAEAEKPSPKIGDHQPRILRSPNTKDASAHLGNDNSTATLITQMQVFSIEETIAAIENRANSEAAAAAAAAAAAKMVV